MRKRMWLKLIKVYDYTINYHPRKATVVADALRRKDRLNMLTMTKELYKEFEKLEIKVCFVAKKRKEIKVCNLNAIHGMLCKIMFQPEHLEGIQKCKDEVMNQGMDGLSREEICTQKYEKGFLRFSSRIWIPNVLDHMALSWRI